MARTRTVGFSVTPKTLPMRAAVCQQKGGPLVGRYAADNLSTFPSLEIAERGPVTPDHVLHCKRIAMISTGNHSEDVAKYAADYKAYFDRNQEGGLTCLDQAPRWALWANKGRFVFAPNGKRLRVISDLIDHTSKCIQWGEYLGGWKALSEKEIFDLEYWELEQAKLKRKKATGSLEGQVALVSGAASGIGLATVQELLVQGACVVGADISHTITELFDGNPSDLGVCCDLTQSSDVRALLDQTVRHFGGLDILVSNAGVFPPSANIEDLSDDGWRDSMAVNLDSHFYLLRESIPFLKMGWNPAVVFVGSKSCQAPGRNWLLFRCQSRLATCSGCDDGTLGRVNTVHPVLVFDTGVWTDDILIAAPQSTT